MSHADTKQHPCLSDAASPRNLCTNAMVCTDCMLPIDAYHFLPLPPQPSLSPLQKADQLAQLAIENRSLKVKYKVLDRMVSMQGENLKSLKSTESAPLSLSTQSHGLGHPALKTLLRLDSHPLGPISSAEEISSGSSSCKSHSIQSTAPVTGDPPETETLHLRDTGNASPTLLETASTFDFTLASARSTSGALLKNDPGRPGLQTELLQLWRYHYGGRPMTVGERKLFEAMGPVQLAERW